MSGNLLVLVTLDDLVDGFVFDLLHAEVGEGVLNDVLLVGDVFLCEQ